MANRSWKLRRFARYTSNAKEKTIPWKIYDGGNKKSPIFLTILDSGYMLVMQGQESLETVHLTNNQDCIKVVHKSDNLMFRFTIKGESRMTRLQFLAKNKEAASKECASALQKVMEFLPQTCLENNTLNSPNQTLTETQATEKIHTGGVRMKGREGKATYQSEENPFIWSRNPDSFLSLTLKHGNDVRREHQPVQGLLPIKKLAQYFLGDAVLTLPEVYHHSHLTRGDFEPLLRLFLLDPSFPAFVEKVEEELKTMLQE